MLEKKKNYQCYSRFKMKCKVFRVIHFAFFLIVSCKSFNYDTKYFEQKVDHFGYTTDDKFQQRYFINSDYFNPINGSIFFYTGNEGDLEMFSNNTGFIWENAPNFNALIVFAEHRYYGKSLPYGAHSYKNNKYLGYLTSEQALADFSNLIAYIKSIIPGARHSPVIAFGGSYGGMLAAWIRIKYPHLVQGAVASSAPILQFQDLTSCEKFYEIVTNDFYKVDHNCALSIKKSWDIIKKYGSTESNVKFLTKLFNLCQPLKVGNVSSLKNWLTDTWSNMAMTDYPYPTSFLVPLPGNPINKACQYLKDASVGEKQLLVNIFKAVSVFQNYTGNVKCFNLNEAGGSSLGEKGWDYQACTEMVMPMCSTGITDMFDFNPWNFTEYSYNCFKKWNVKPDLYKAVTVYGGRNITSSSNIIFTNGKLDPWHAGGVLKSLSPSLIAIQIDDAAHHLDLRFSNSADPASVKGARAIIKRWIHKWCFSQAQK